MISGVSLEKSPRLPSLEGERNSGIGGGKIPPAPQYGDGGGGGGEEKVFFDDGQVKVTESLVTIGPPWNKTFAVSQIRGVTYGKNKSTELTDSLMRVIGTRVSLPASSPESGCYGEGQSRMLPTA
ncbi:hypothetical protein EBZ02_08120 [bacterium]|nr:hypothetical protein [bacterium]